MSKQAYHETVFDDTPTLGNVRLRIEGLRQVGDDTFELSGVQVREIDWRAVQGALGRDDMPDALAARIDQACFQYDIAELLASRIKRDES